MGMTLFTIIEWGIVSLLFIAVIIVFLYPIIATAKGDVSIEINLF
jgi:hypothetical protein